MNQEPTASQEFKNEKVSIQLSEEPGCLVKLKVVATPALTASAHEEALKRVRKEVSLPGFRKGKAPDALLFKHYANAITKEWKDCLLQTAFSESIRLTKRVPLKSAAGSIKSSFQEINSPSDSATIQYQFESEPNVPSLEVKELHLGKPQVEAIKQEEINDTLHQTQLVLATWEQVEGRPAEAGDFVRLDIERVHGDHTHAEFNDKRFQIVEKKMSPWMRNLVVGLSVGESAEGVSAPEESLDTELDEETKASFKPTPYRITLKAIEKPTLPELNDEFAKKVGGTSMQDVEEKIRQQLTRAAEGKAKEKLTEQLEELLVQKYSFDLPQSVIEQESKIHEERHLQQLRGGEECADDEIAREMPSVREKARKDCVRQLTLFYIFRNYNHNQGISVSQDEMNAELAYLLRNVPQEHLQYILKSLDEVAYRSIFSNLVTRKGLDHLLSQIQAAS